MSCELPSIESVRQSIPLERIRLQTLPKVEIDGKRKQKPNEMWGIVKLNDLWLCFKAWPSGVHPNLELSGERTRWGFTHVPRNPLEFVPSLRTEPLTEHDKAYMLRNACVEENVVSSAMEGGIVDQLFVHTLEKRADQYRQLDQLYRENKGFSAIYRHAVAKACDERQVQLTIT